MNTRTVSISSLLAVLLSLLPTHSFAGDERKERIVALVTRIVAPEKDRADTFTLRMIIHRPTRFRGFEFMATTDSTDRTKIRADFPVGSLQVLELPDKTMNELEDQVAPHLAVEKMLDGGIDPAMISQTVMIPYVRIADLPQKPVAYDVSAEQAEQGGTGQPATRPESKSEGGDKPQPEAEGRSR